MPDSGTTQHIGANVAGSGRGTHGLDNLPLELVDLVFRHAASLNDAKKTIIACACVSRLWRKLSLPHLFSSLKVVNLHDFYDFSTFLATRPDLARHIQILTLARLRRYGMLPVAEAVLGPNISHSGLVNIAARLPKLRELHLDTVFILDSGIDPTSPTALLPPHFRLKKLSMHSCCGRVGQMTLFPLTTLVDTLRILPADVVDLSWLTLACDAGDVTFDGVRLPAAPRWPNEGLQVSTLILDRIASRSSWPPIDTMRFYGVLRQVLAPQCIRSFQAQRRKDLHSTRPKPTFDKRNPNALCVLGELLEHAGGDALQHLSLPFSIGGVIEYPEDRPEHWRILRLHKCQSLQSFSLSIHKPPDHPPPTPRILLSAGCIALLVHLPTTLRTFTLILWPQASPEEIEDQTTLNLQALDEFLVTRFPQLAEVEVLLHLNGTFDRSSEAVINAMQRCNERQILEVRRWGRAWT
ncbi:hypothetical protein GY45DRAFT_1321950 [Cubamyces sp. BRFM 1775]|nr:hypothetical protein GY45DRAFT_1321950 [Cubamyces sp. BRFM 1775]